METQTKVQLPERKLVLPGEFTSEDRRMIGLTPAPAESTIKWTKQQGGLFVPVNFD